MNRLLTSTLTLTLFLTACNNNETSKSKDVNPDAIFFDYKIRGYEKDSNATVYIQYRMGGPNGTALVLKDPAKVELDGGIIPSITAKLNGVFYEILKPSGIFTGQHSILFTDFNSKEYKEEFIYQPFELRTDLPATITRKNLVFDFVGVDLVDYITVSMTDTSFTSKDINQVDTVKNGRLIIPAELLKNLVDGPITLQFNKYIERPLQNATKTGGRISFSYGLQREFELKAP